MIWTAYKAASAKARELESQLALIQSQLEINNATLVGLSQTQETIRQESAALRRGLRELRDADPQVKDYLNTPVPDNLRRLYQDGNGIKGTSGKLTNTTSSSN